MREPAAPAVAGPPADPGRIHRQAATAASAAECGRCTAHVAVDHSARRRAAAGVALLLCSVLAGSTMAAPAAAQDSARPVAAPASTEVVAGQRATAESAAGPGPASAPLASSATGSDSAATPVLAQSSASPLASSVQAEYTATAPAPPAPIRFGGDARYAPFHFLDGDGRARGFDVALFEAAATQAGWSWRHELGDWGESLVRLERGELDVVPMFISAARRARYRFTEPFLNRHHLVFGRRGGDYVANLQALSGKRVAVQFAGLAWEALGEIRPYVRIVPMDNEADTIAAVRRQEADFAVVPATIGYDAVAAASDGQIVALSPPLLPMAYAFAVTPGRPELVAPLNAALAQVRADGTQDRLYFAWLANLNPARGSFRAGLAIGISLAAALLALAIVLLVRWRRARAHAQRSERRADTEVQLRRDAEARARYLAFHDPATTLPNRNSLELAVPAAISRQRLGGRGVAVVRLDLVDLDMVRTIAGESVLADLLRTLATRLRGEAGAEAVFATGRGEFAVVVEGYDDAAAVERLARRLLAAVHLRLALHEFAIEPRARVGIAEYPTHANEAGELLRAADMACITARELGVPVVCYARALEPDPRNLSLLADLREAIADGTLGYALQPKLDLRTRRIVGAEMLVRWQHPARGPLPPSLFVPLAERTGLIGEMTHYLVRRALAHLRDWQQRGLDLSLSVNVSVNDLADVSLVDELVSEVQGVRGGLMLEVTETDVMRDADGILASTQRLRAHGVRISLDDFGIGHASFVYLRRMAPDEIKIDRSFIAELDSSRSDQAIVQTSIQLAHTLGAVVTAEGIEDPALLSWLALAGCDLAQGFAIARPLPVEDFLRIATTPLPMALRAR